MTYGKFPHLNRMWGYVPPRPLRIKGTRIIRNGRPPKSKSVPGLPVLTIQRRET